VSSSRKTPEPSTLQLVINHLATRMFPPAIIHSWLSARRAGADRRRTRRRTPALALAAGALVAAVTLLSGSGASAQSGPPTVVVKASPAAVAVESSGTLAAGATRFVVERTGAPVNVYFALLDAGVSQRELEEALAADDRSGGDSSLGLVSVRGSVSLAAEASRAVTFTLRPGLSYLLVAESAPAESGAVQRSFTTFTTAPGPAGADAPAAAATVRMQGLRFRGAKVLPQRGTVRVENRDGAAHVAVAFPLRRGVTNKRLGRALARPGGRAFGRVITGTPYALQSVLSGGNITNDVEVAFPRPGRYGLVCFVGEHYRLGMHRIVTVRG
jgi:hypothetical protein